METQHKKKSPTAKKPQRDPNVPYAVPFSSVEEAWFWFIRAQQASQDGARFNTGFAMVPRPCEPVDIMKILDNLLRTRMLIRDHVLVLRHYGLRYLPPDTKRIKERRAAVLWGEAMDKLEPPMIRKGIVTNIVPFPDPDQRRAP